MFPEDDPDSDDMVEFIVKKGVIVELHETEKKRQPRRGSLFSVRNELFKIHN